MEPQIEEYGRQAREQARRVEALGKHLSDARIRWRPPSGKWTIGQHLVHTAITTRGYLVVIDPAVQEARSRGHLAPGPYEGGLVGRWFVRSLAPPPRLRIKTFRELEPPENPSGEEAIGAFRAASEELLSSLERADGVDLSRARMRSPFVRLLKMSVSQGYEAVLRHADRHLWHVERIQEDPAFPAE